MTGAMLHRLATQYRQALDTEVFHCRMAWSRFKPTLAPRSGSLQWSWGEP